MLSTTYLKVCAKEQCCQLAQTETGTVDEQLQLVYAIFVWVDMIITIKQHNELGEKRLLSPLNKHFAIEITCVK